MAMFNDDSLPAAEENYIRNLPVELLVQIFLSAYYFTTERHVRFQLPFNLLQVASLWRKVVLNEPRLWAYTFYGDNWSGPPSPPPIEAISFQLTHSRNRLLEITIDLRWWHPDSQTIDQLIDTLVQHRNRWVTFSLYTNRKDGMMEHILRKIPEHFPELRQLILQCGSRANGWDYSRLPKRLVCPKLQVLQLRGTILCKSSLRSSVLPSLSSAFFADIQIEWDDWRAALHQGSKLLELEIRNASIGRSRASILTSAAPVYLPHLQRLALNLRHLIDDVEEAVAELDAMISSFFAPKLHTLLIDLAGVGTGTPLPPKSTWDKAMPGLKTLVIRVQGDTDAVCGIFRRCPHITHLSISDSRVEGHALATEALESLADPSTGPLLDRLDTLTLTMMIPTYEGWEHLFPRKTLQVYINSLFEGVMRKRIDRKSLREREVALEKLKAVVPLEICRVPRDDTWFSNKWRFGGDD